MSDLKSVNRSLAAPQPNLNPPLDGSPLRPGTPVPWMAPLSLGENEGLTRIRLEPGLVPGQASATEVLLGLQLEPTKCGAFPPPPGNDQALRHLTSPTRRAMLRAILLKRSRLRYLAALLYRDPDADETGAARNGSSGSEASADERLMAQARHELSAAANLINLLDHLQEMQDYTLSRMGMFSKG